MEKKRNLRI